MVSMHEDNKHGWKCSYVLLVLLETSASVNVLLILYNQEGKSMC